MHILPVHDQSHPGIWICSKEPTINSEKPPKDNVKKLTWHTGNLPLESCVSLGLMVPFVLTVWRIRGKIELHLLRYLAHYEPNTTKWFEVLIPSSSEHRWPIDLIELIWMFCKIYYVLIHHILYTMPYPWSTILEFFISIFFGKKFNQKVLSQLSLLLAILEYQNRDPRLYIY